MRATSDLCLNENYDETFDTFTDAHANDTVMDICRRPLPVLSVVFFFLRFSVEKFFSRFFFLRYFFFSLFLLFFSPLDRSRREIDAFDLSRYVEKLFSDNSYLFYDGWYLKRVLNLLILLDFDLWKLKIANSCIIIARWSKKLYNDWFLFSHLCFSIAPPSLLSSEFFILSGTKCSPVIERF